MFTKRGSKGFTLIEVLVAVVILSIILLTFFGFFSQSALFTNRNKQQLTAVNLAQEVIATMKSNSAVFQRSKTFEQPFTEQEKAILGIDDSHYFVDSKQQFILKLELRKDENYPLYLIHVFIENADHSVVAEVYHFLEGS
ncbi:type IV pilus modification PilV family protein [Schinkia sp. CFF1]